MRSWNMRLMPAKARFFFAEHLAFVAAVATACRAEVGAPRDSGSRVTVVNTQPAVPTIAAPSVPAKPASPPKIDLPRVGFPAMPAISAASRAANREGLVHHRAGRFSEAQSRFAKSIEDSLDHDMARFNLACALAKLGQPEAAATHLEILIERDPRRFSDRIRSEADLDGVRDSAGWNALVQRLAAADVAVDLAFATGVPASMFHYGKIWMDNGKQRGGTQDHILGLYVHSSRRFVPPLERRVRGYDKSRSRPTPPDPLYPSYPPESIVHVHDAGELPDGRRFLAMEFVRGREFVHRTRARQRAVLQDVPWVQWARRSAATTGTT